MVASVVSQKDIQQAVMELREIDSAVLAVVKGTVKPDQGSVLLRFNIDHMKATEIVEKRMSALSSALRAHGTADEYRRSQEAIAEAEGTLAREGARIRKEIEGIEAQLNRKKGELAALHEDVKSAKQDLQARDNARGVLRSLIPDEAKAFKAEAEKPIREKYRARLNACRKQISAWDNVKNLAPPSETDIRQAAMNGHVNPVRKRQQLEAEAELGREELAKLEAELAEELKIFAPIEDMYIPV